MRKIITCLICCCLSSYAFALDENQSKENNPISSLTSQLEQQDEKDEQGQQNQAIEKFAAGAIGSTASYMMVKNVVSWIAPAHVATKTAIAAAGIGFVLGYWNSKIIWFKFL